MMAFIIRESQSCPKSSIVRLIQTRFHLDIPPCLIINLVSNFKHLNQNNIKSLRQSLNHGTAEMAPVAIVPSSKCGIFELSLSILYP